MRDWVLAGCLCVIGSSAQAGELELAGTARARYETVAGQVRPGFNSADDLVSFRTTLSAQYQAGPVKVFAELWDSRVYGANRRTPVTTGEVNALELVQAYVQADLGDAAGGGTTTTMQAGRFMLNLGSRRLVAADDYRNTTNGYTGLRLDIAGRNGWRGVAVYVLPQQRRPDDLDALLHNRVRFDHEGFDQVLWGGLVSRDRAIGGGMLEASFFHLGERDTPHRPTRDRSLDSLSVRYLREPAGGLLDLELEAIAQRGQVSTGLAAAAARQAVRAWFVHADSGYSFAGGWKPRLSVEFDYASGDGRGGRFGRFDSMFGMRRADFAPPALYGELTRSNIVTPGVRLELTPDRKTDGFLSYRPMWLASRYDSFAASGVRDATGRSGRFAGHQLDSRIRHKLTRAVSLEADGVLLRKGRFLTDASNAPPKKWTEYLSFSISAAF